MSKVMNGALARMVGATLAASSLDAGCTFVVDRESSRCSVDADCASFSLAADIDPAYAAAFAAARAAGVEAIAHATRIDREGVRIDAALPVDV